MNDQTKTQDEKERPLRLHLTIPGPICGCPVTVLLECSRNRPNDASAVPTSKPSTSSTTRSAAWASTRGAISGAPTSTTTGRGGKSRSGTSCPSFCRT